MKKGDRLLYEVLSVEDDTVMFLNIDTGEQMFSLVAENICGPLEVGDIVVYEVTDVGNFNNCGMNFVRKI